jgi:hypothetical protein
LVCIINGVTFKTFQYLHEGDYYRNRFKQLRKARPPSSLAKKKLSDGIEFVFGTCTISLTYISSLAVQPKRLNISFSQSSSSSFVVAAALLLLLALYGIFRLTTLVYEIVFQLHSGMPFLPMVLSYELNLVIYLSAIFLDFFNYSDNRECFPLFI